MEESNQLERQHQESLKQDAGRLFQVFPEAKQILLRNQKLYQRKINAAWETHRKQILLLQRQGYSSNDLVIVLQLRLLLDRELQELDKSLKYINRELAGIRLKQNAKPYTNTFNLQIEHARSVEILQLCNMLGINLKREMALCPLHPDKTPSFKVYTQQNRYHCFGCQSSGDSIQLVMNLRHLGFKEAVLFINSLLC